MTHSCLSRVVPGGVNDGVLDRHVGGMCSSRSSDVGVFPRYEIWMELKRLTVILEIWVI